MIVAPSTASNPPPVFAPGILARLDALAACTDEPGALTRLYLSLAHARAAALVQSWMWAAKLEVSTTALGDVVGRYEGTTAGAPALVLASHIDSVRNAGRFDGTLGVCTAIEVVAALAESGQRLPFAIEVIAFGDEEGARFTSTLSGSLALTGRFDNAILDEIDRHGVSRRAALIAFGCDLGQIDAALRPPGSVRGYLEVHIEQGPVLEAKGLPVAVVTAIAGASRGTIRLQGEAGHAGTVPMALRRDALAAAAEIVLAVEKRGQAVADLVATVGRCEVEHGAANTVPGAVTLTLDVRSPVDATRRAALADIRQAVAAVAEARGISATIEIPYEAPAAIADTALVDALSGAVRAVGHPVEPMVSGAGHDAMAMHGFIPFAMLFVRCRRGISHHPDEFASKDDIEVAAQVLWRTLLKLPA